jgi:HlyD family secretion protein
MKHLKVVIILVVIVAAVAAYLVITQTTYRHTNIIHVSGNIEVTDVEASFKIPGRVVERPVDEGQTIAKGDLIALLDTSALEKDVALRKAELAAAQAALAELKAGSRPEEIAAAEAIYKKAKYLHDELVAGSRPEEIATADAAVKQAEASARFAEQENKRQSDLFKQGAVPEQDRDLAQANYDSAVAKLHQAQAQYELVKKGPRQEDIDQAAAAMAQAEQQYILVKKGPRIETIQQAEAHVGQAQAALELAETELGYAKLTSSLSGVVLSKNIEPGEYVVPGTPIVTVADLTNIWVRAYINEPDLARVKLGQKARITSDSYPGKVYEGRVSFISSEAEFTPKTVQTPKERVRLVYRIKIDITNQNMELKPGMPVDADIILDEGNK